MRFVPFRDVSLVCVILVSATCVGCYKPAAGSASSDAARGTSTTTRPIAAEVPSPTADQPQPSSTAPDADAAVATSDEASAIDPTDPTSLKSIASASGTADNAALSASVEAALRNPQPGIRPAMQPGGTGATPPVASRSPSRSPIRTKVLGAPEASGGVRGLTFDDLVFPIEKDQPFVEALLTDSIRNLFGTKIKIRGYIHPSCPFQTGVTSFILVRDDQSCCFGPGAALYDCILVNMVPGRTTNFTPKPIAVEGVLTLREFRDLDGKHLAVYHLAGEAAE